MTLYLGQSCVRYFKIKVASTKSLLGDFLLTSNYASSTHPTLYNNHKKISGFVLSLFKFYLKKLVAVMIFVWLWCVFKGNNSYTLPLDKTLILIFSRRLVQDLQSLIIMYIEFCLVAVVMSLAHVQGLGSVHGLFLRSWKSLKLHWTLFFSSVLNVSQFVLPILNASQFVLPILNASQFVLPILNANLFFPFWMWVSLYFPF